MQLDDWWSWWWHCDYSWSGLARKAWVGWCVDERNEVIEASKVPKGSVVMDMARLDPEDVDWPRPPAGSEYRSATLQDYWREEAEKLVALPDGELFTRMHLPYFSRAGVPLNLKERSEAVQIKLLDKKLRALEPSGPETDRRAQLQGIVLDGFAHHANQGRGAHMVNANFRDSIFFVA